MIICTTCCDTKCKYSTHAGTVCPKVYTTPIHHGMQCGVCGQKGDCFLCGFFEPLQEQGSASTPPPAISRFLEVLIPVAETLAERGKKYEGVYETLRERYGPTAFALEIDKKLLRWIRCPDDEVVAQEAFLDIIGYVILEKEYLQKRKESQPIRAKLRFEDAVPKVVEPDEGRKEGTD